MLLVPIENKSFSLTVFGVYCKVVSYFRHTSKVSSRQDFRGSSTMIAYTTADVSNVNETRAYLWANPLSKITTLTRCVPHSGYP